jgi:hypothetical protein
MNSEYHKGYEEGIEVGRVIANQMYQDGLYNNPLPRIVMWNIDRKLDIIEPDNGLVVYCKLEELFEFLGINKCFQDEKQFKFLVNKYKKYILDEASSMNAKATIEEKIDALCDDTVFNTGFVMRYGYDPTMALTETVLEIESRTGVYDEEQSKWIKDKSEEAKSRWYEARYEKCLL